MISNTTMTPSTYAYLRVSTDEQSVENQKHGISDYLAKSGIESCEWYADTETGRSPWKKRKLADILQICTSGDLLIISEITRIERSTLGVLSFLQAAAEKGLRVYVSKNHQMLNDGAQARAMAVLYALFGEMEGDIIRQRTREAMDRRRKSGKPLGRQVGQVVKLKLEQHAADIIKFRSKGLSMTAIAKLCDCSTPTVKRWLKRSLAANKMDPIL